MEKTDTRFHHASGKDTPLLVDTRMAAFLHKKRPGLSHLFQCTERPSTVPPVPDGKIFGSGRFLLIGLDHNDQDITQGIIEQGITTSPIHIGEHTIIGANVIVLPGITIGKHCFIGAGCVVTQNIPDYCVTVGNPARIIKRYNPQSQTWEKI